MNQRVGQDNIYHNSQQDEINFDSLNDSFIIHESKPDHHFRTEIPNIVFELDLSPIDFKVYCLIKNIASDSGYCSFTIPNLAKRCQVSERSIQNSLNNLSKIFPLLNSPLISIHRRKKHDGSPDTSKIIIIPIWSKNGDYYRTGKKGVVQNMHQGGAKFADKQELEANKQEQYIDNRHCSPIVNESVPCQDVIVNVECDVSGNANQENVDPQKEAYKWMVEHGCEPDLAKWIANKYSSGDIASASIYMLAQMAKPKFTFKKPKWAYFQHILKNRYWEKPRLE